MEVNLTCSDNLVIVGSEKQEDLCLSLDKVQHERSKHIHVKNRVIRAHIMSGTIRAKYVPSDKMLADVMTNSFGRINHELFFRLIGMQC